MEIEEIEAVLEKLWDLHDKLSDAIHSISRTHFLNSIKSVRSSCSDKKKLYPNGDVAKPAAGFVFVKDVRAIDDDDYFSAIQEVKSLNCIRVALEDLEDQLEFFHMVETQQRAERDAAIARLEQSRIVLAKRLSEHHGKEYKVIEEARAFVGNVDSASRFVSPENLYTGSFSPSNFLLRGLISGFDFANKSLKLDHLGGMLGNVAIFTLSMIALRHLHHVAYKGHQRKEDLIYINRDLRKAAKFKGSSSGGSLNQLDVTLARG